MRSILGVFSMLLLSILSSAVPVRNSGIDTIKNVAKRDGLTMGTTTKRSPRAEPEEDADEAIAYAWFTEETEGTARTVKIEEEDAEAWSNLAAALLRLPVTEQNQSSANDSEVGVDEATSLVDSQKNVKSAFVAFKRGAKLKRDSYRIWQNLLNVATTISPPPYDDIIIAQQRIIELRSSTEGEGCVDLGVMEGLLRHVIAIASEKPKLQNNGTEDGGQPKRRYGLEAMFIDLVQKHIVPLIHSRRLWQLVAKLSIHQNMPSTALDACEKAWRVTLNKPGWDDGSAAASSNAADVDTPEQVWQAVVDSTIELIDAYESLGDKEVTEGLGAGTGQLVAQNWRYKARMAVRSVTGRRSKTGLEDFEQLQARMAELKSG